MTCRDVESRYYEHVKVSESKSTTTLSKAIRKYGDKLIISVLLEGSEEYCLMIENKLRPSERIGWNIAIGGGKPPRHTKHTEEAKAKISAASKASTNSPANLAARLRRKGVKRSEESKAKMKEKAQGRLPWETSLADKELWARADEFYEAFKANPNYGNIKLEQLLNLPKNSLRNMYYKFKNHNWNPLIDTNWLDWVQKFKQFKGII